MGPLPETSSGMRYILVFIDSLTKWTECIPLDKTDAPEIANFLYMPSWMSDYTFMRHSKKCIC